MDGGRQRRPPPPRPAAQASHGPIARTLHTLSTVLLTLVAALLIAIAIQCVGRRLWWPEEGPGHTVAMLHTELSHLRDVRASLVTADPAAFAISAVAFADEWLWRKTGGAELVAWITAVPPEGATLLRTSLHVCADDLRTAVATTQMLAVRLAVLILAMPLFALIAIVGVVDGLVERDVRRWSGGRESSYLFHLAKQFLSPAILLCWMLYLCMPVSLSPGLVVLPFAALFALALRLTVASFKKYI